jgi:hypothetical protein
VGKVILFARGVSKRWTENICPFVTVVDKNLVGIPLYLQETLGYDTKERLVIVPMYKHPPP